MNDMSSELATPEQPVLGVHNGCLIIPFEILDSIVAEFDVNQVGQARVVFDTTLMRHGEIVDAIRARIKSTGRYRRLMSSAGLSTP